MRTPHPLPKVLLAGAAFLAALALHPQNASGQSPASPPQQQPSSEALPLIDTEQHLGVFAIGGQMYAVIAREKSISPASDAKFATTLSELEIRDADEAAVYQESFPYDVQEGHFAQKLSASASVLAGAGGSALVIRFLEEPAAPGEGESWRVFGLVNGKLAPLGAPLPLGQGSGSAVGGVLTGVMVRGGIGVVPLASTAESLEFRAWTGNFFVHVPVRVDWAQGQWSEAEQCFELNGGSLRQKGCNLRIAANARPRRDGVIVTLRAEPADDRYNERHVSVGSGSPVEFLLARAVVNWKNSGERITCRFGDVWLRVRIGGSEGWVHSEPDFAALGLPAASPPQ
jgi:hypothetical protein